MIYSAWNYGVAPVFDLNAVDWAGAVAMNILRMLWQGMTVLPVAVTKAAYINSNKDTNDEPPKTL